MPVNSFNKIAVFTIFVFPEEYKIVKNRSFVFPEEYKIVDNRVFVCYDEYKTDKEPKSHMIIRQAYLDKIIPFIDKQLIKVLTGVRRSGKTVLLSQIQDLLSERGINKEQIVYISFESVKNEHLQDYHALYDFLVSAAKSVGGRLYIFLDEIQTVASWEKVVASLLVDIDCDIYITGSNSKLLSGELATLIAGRYVQIHVYPFVLSEAKQLLIQKGKSVSDEQLFQDYLRYGGLPMRFTLDPQSTEIYLSDTYDAIVMKDILSRNKVADENLLSVILDFLMDNIANPFSARAVVAALQANGIKTTVNTVLMYIEYIKKAMIMNAVQRYDIKGKRLLSSAEKYYSVDLGLRNIRKTSNSVDNSKLYENIVYLELLYRGYDVKVGKTDEYEIDFVAYKGKEVVYIQVAYLLSSEEVVAREFGNLERIKDHYPKVVISGDLPDFSQNGIRHYNIIDFLLNR